MYRSTEYKRLQSEQRQQPQQQGEAMAVAADGGRTSDAMMPQQQISTEEIVRRGEEIYERDLKARYDTPENRGKFLVIDVFSGDYEIAEDDLSATEPILERHPSALTFGIRIGYDAAYDMFAAHGARGA